MSAKQPGSGPSSSSSDQRRTPRINVRNRLSGYIVSLDRDVVVRDISLGGFSVESEAELPTGVHVVRLQEGDRWSVTVTAASRHHRVAPAPGGKVRHVMGFEYEDQSPDTQQTIRVLFERLAADRPTE
jgi:hypothetical protein